MSKLNVNQKKTIKEQVATHKTATKNKAGGLAFEFTNPAEYLLGTIGSAMFVEPKFYHDTEKPEDLKNREFSTEGLDEQAIKIINACFEIADGKSPRDLLALANWARNELNMRTTPQIMLAVAANHENTKQFVRKYVPLISSRADEVKQVVGAYEHLFGWKGFPACLKKGVSDRLSTMTEYEIMKYNTSGHPSFKDLLGFCERREGYPFSKEIREYIVSGEVINPEATPMFAARKELTSRKTWSKDIPMLAKKAGITWEVLISQFGNRKEVWEAVIPQMGYMALLRNIGNFLSADISTEMCRYVAEHLSNKENVQKSKQLPFRFLAAYRTISPDESVWFYRMNKQAVERDRGSWDKQKAQMLLNSVETALDNSIYNLPILPGITCIVADNSGSMTQPISSDSTMLIKDAANILCAILQKRSKESLAGAFGTNTVWPQLTANNSVITNMTKIATYQDSYRGHGTEAWTIFEYLISKRVKVDRVVILSDMQCYGTHSVAEKLKQYQRAVNPNVYVHFYDLKGYGTRQAPVSDKINLVAGFSEKIFNQILSFEGAEAEDGRVLPSLEYIRINY